MLHQQISFIKSGNGKKGAYGFYDIMQANDLDDVLSHLRQNSRNVIG